MSYPRDPTRRSPAELEQLTAAELGLGADAHVPLQFSPARSWSPLVISLPHVGLAWPHDLRPKPLADVARNADFEVQTLYREVSLLGAATVTAVYSRLVVDLNRAPDDVARSLVPDHPAPRPRRSPGDPGSTHPDAHEPARAGRGVVWTHAVGHVRILDGPLGYAAFRDRIDRFHAPYFRALRILLERRRKMFGFAILLDAHSHPSSVGVDLVLGTLEGASCDPEIARAAHQALDTGPSGDGASTHGPKIVMRRDFPYRGGEVVRTFGRPRDGVHALQLEVSRALYMDEVSLRLHHPPASDPGSPGWGTMRGLERGPHAHAAAVAGRTLLALADLQRRVRCLVTTLAGLTRSDLHLERAEHWLADRKESRSGTRSATSAGSHATTNPTPGPGPAAQATPQGRERK